MNETYETLDAILSEKKMWLMKKERDKQIRTNDVRNEHDYDQSTARKALRLDEI